MYTTKEIGDRSELYAAHYLQEKEHVILAQNYRYKRNEIDLISQDKNTIVFVEVKSRRNIGFGYPEEAVDNKKADRIREAADNYTYEHNWDGMIRFDIIALIHKGDEIVEVEHFEDAF